MADTGPATPLVADTGPATPLVEHGGGAMAEPQAATMTESRTATMTESRTATMTESRTATMTESRTATTTEMKTAINREHKVATMPESQATTGAFLSDAIIIGKTATTTEATTATEEDLKTATATEARTATEEDLKTATAAEARTATEEVLKTATNEDPSLATTTESQATNGAVLRNVTLTAKTAITSVPKTAILSEPMTATTAATTTNTRAATPIEPSVSNESKAATKEDPQDAAAARVASLVVVQRVLMATFVGVITGWYFTTPYMVRPHPQFGEDMKQLIANMSEGGQAVENWTKWRLFLTWNSGKLEVAPMSQVKVGDLAFPTTATLEWRQHYVTVLEQDWWSGTVSVVEKHPWYSGLGIYRHYHTEVQGGTVRFVPNFLFGLSLAWVEKLYPGGAQQVPIIGMITECVDRDRVIVQCFMNLVIVAVVLMLFMNNPPKTAKHPKSS